MREDADHNNSEYVHFSGSASVCLKRKTHNTDIEALSSKKKLLNALATLELPDERTIAECQRKLMKHQENISKQYERVNCNQDVIMFDNFQKNVIQALAIADSNLW